MMLIYFEENVNEVLLAYISDGEMVVKCGTINNQRTVFGSKMKVFKPELLKVGDKIKTISKFDSENLYTFDYIIKQILEINMDECLQRYFGHIKKKK